MQCPACANALREMMVDGITVDVCRGRCGGVWFDRFELKKLDEPHEGGGVELLDIERAEHMVIDHSQRRYCPRCEDMVMLRHFWSVKRDVEVDECPGCGGFWLDEGELGHIRSMFKTEEERKQAALAYFGEVFGGQLAAMSAESAEKAQKAQQIAKMFRFIAPSFYIPGKQQGAAF